MTPDRLLADTYSYFHEHGSWPFVRTIQATYGPTINIRALAAEAGRDSIICQEGADGHLVLMLAALARLPEARGDLERLARAVAILADAFAERGPIPVGIRDIAVALGLQDTERRRIGALLLLSGRLWSAAQGAPESPDFSITPAEQVFFFKGISSFVEFESRREQIERDDRRIGQILTDEYRHTHGQSALQDTKDDTQQRYRLADPVLDGILQVDLAELSVVHGLGAWKSTAVLAGSCLETLLFDLCKQREIECQSKWGNKWPGQVNASDLAAFATARGWITQDQGGLVTVLRRWRNIVHPHTASIQGAPYKELADALTAVLRLLVADLSRNDAA